MVVVEVLSIKRLEGVGKQSHKPYAMDIATCVVRSGESVSAGEIILPKDHKCELGGRYVPEFVAGMFQGRIEFQIGALRPVAVAAAVSK